MLCRYLRQKGYHISPLDEADALTALTLLPIHRKDNFKEALRSVLSKNHYEYIHFFDLYEEFWYELSRAVDAKVKNEVNIHDKQSESQKKQDQFKAIQDWLNLSPSEDEEAISAHSEIEVLTRKSFADLSKEEMELMMRLLQKMAKKIAHQKSRLKTNSRRKKNIDLKRTIRASMRNGGEVSSFVHSRHKEKNSSWFFYVM